MLWRRGCGLENGIRKLRWRGRRRISGERNFHTRIHRTAYLSTVTVGVVGAVAAATSAIGVGAAGLAADALAVARFA